MGEGEKPRGGWHCAEDSSICPVCYLSRLILEPEEQVVTQKLSCLEAQSNSFMPHSLSAMQTPPQSLLQAFILGETMGKK